MPDSRGLTPKSRLAIFERREKILTYAKFGLSNREIKKALETRDGIVVSTSTVYRDIDACLKNARARVSRNADQLLNLQMERLENLMKSNWVAANKGDTKAAGVAMGAIDRMNRLMGIGAPKRIQLDGHEDANPIQVEKRVQLDLSGLSLDEAVALKEVLAKVSS